MRVGTAIIEYPIVTCSIFLDLIFYIHMYAYFKYKQVLDTKFKSELRSMRKRISTLIENKFRILVYLYVLVQSKTKVTLLNIMFETARIEIDIIIIQTDWIDLLLFGITLYDPRDRTRFYIYICISNGI